MLGFGARYTLPEKLRGLVSGVLVGVAVSAPTGKVGVGVGVGVSVGICVAVAVAVGVLVGVAVGCESQKSLSGWLPGLGKLYRTAVQPEVKPPTPASEPAAE